MSLRPLVALAGVAALTVCAATGCGTDIYFGSLPGDPPPVRNPGGVDAGSDAAPTPVDLVEYSDFGSIAGLTLLGDARQLGSELELVPDSNERVGGFYVTMPFAWTENSRLSVRFAFRVTHMGLLSADGLVFVIHDDPRGLMALGYPGGNLGYAGLEGITPSVGLELDTYGVVDDMDPNSNHAALLRDGSLVPLSLADTLPVDLASGIVVFVWLDVDETSDVVDVYMSDDDQKPVLPLMTHSISLLETVGERFFAGIVSATGRETAQHVVQHLSIARFVE